MEGIILLVVSVILVIKGDKIADFLTDKNTNTYRKMFGDRVDRIQPFLKQVNKWGLRFGALVFFLMSMALLFGPIEI